MPEAETRHTLFAIVAITLVVLAACIVLDRPLVRGDGLAYFMWLDSLARDFDLDLSNQASQFAHVNTYHVFLYAKTGRYASVFPFGSSLLLVPFYWVSRVANRLPWFHVNDAYFLQHQGATFPFSFFPMVGTNLYAVAAVILAYLSARRFASQRASLAAALALFFGTPLWYYSTIEPFSSHVAGSSTLSLLTYLLVRWWTRRPSETVPAGRLWLAMGIVAGLAAVVRWQLALVALPLAVYLLWHKRWSFLARFAAGFVAVAWLVPYSWWRMFGSPWVIPAAEQNRAAFLVWPEFAPQVLFSAEKGLFVWAPLTGLALLGLVPLARRHRGLSLSLAALFLLQTLINGAVYDWWAGWGFGMRRMVELYPVFVVGLAVLLSQRMGRGRLRQAWAGLMYLLSAALVAFAMLLLLSHLNFVNTVLDRPQGDSALREIRYQLRESSFRITWLVIKDHYGPWAWRQPGP